MGECLILKSGGGTDTSDATATKEVILSGYTAYVNDVKLIGEMTNHGDLSDNVDAGTFVDISSGYYSGGTISANSLASQTDANATAAQILKSYTAWVKGSLITGTMTNRGTINTSLAANRSYTIPAGWHKGDGVVSQSITVADGGSFNPTTTNRIIFSSGRYAKTAVKINGNANLKAENIKNGVKIFGVTGTFTNSIFTDSSYGLGGVTPIAQQAPNSGYVEWCTWAPTLTIDDGTIKLVGPCISLRTTNTIDLTSASRFNMVIHNTSDARWTYLQEVWLRAPGDAPNWYYCNNTGTRFTTTKSNGNTSNSDGSVCYNTYVDVSDITGSWYLYMWGGKNTSTTKTFRICKLYIS